MRLGKFRPLLRSGLKSWRPGEHVVAFTPSIDFHHLRDERSATTYQKIGLEPHREPPRASRRSLPDDRASDPHAWLAAYPSNATECTSVPLQFRKGPVYHEQAEGIIRHFTMTFAWCLP